MRRRRLRRLVAVVGLAALTAGAVALWPRPNRVTQENCDRIREGMSRAEVEGILGPPGDYTTALIDHSPGFATLLSPVPARQGLFLYFSDDDRQHSQACWCSNNYEVVLAFDTDAKVEYIGGVKVTLVEQGAARNLVWRKAPMETLVPEELVREAASATAGTIRPGRASRGRVACPRLSVDMVIRSLPACRFRAQGHFENLYWRTRRPWRRWFSK